MLVQVLEKRKAKGPQGGDVTENDFKDGGDGTAIAVFEAILSTVFPMLGFFFGIPFPDISKPVVRIGSAHKTYTYTVKDHYTL